MPAEHSIIIAIEPNGTITVMAKNEQVTVPSGDTVTITDEDKNTVITLQPKRLHGNSAGKPVTISVFPGSSIDDSFGN